jgi:hypothetical protein
MKRFFKILLSIFVLEFGVLTIGTNSSESNMLSRSQLLYADPPEKDDEPPDDPIFNSPAPQDTVIFGPYGEPIIIILE